MKFQYPAKLTARPMAALFVVLVLAEVVFITIILKDMYLARTSVSVIPLNGKALAQNVSPTLKYYYEPKPYSKEPLDLLARPSWLKSTPVYTLNSEGFNNAKEYAIPKPPKTFRIETLGDSFTFGQFVDTAQAWPAVLERLLNADPPCKGITYEVLNLGVPGYDIQYAPERFRLRGEKFDPDLVIWFMKNDDLQDIISIIKGMALAYSTTSIATQADFDRATFEFGRTFGDEKKIPLQESFMRTLDNYFHKELLVMTFPFTFPEYKTPMRAFALSHARGYFFDGLTDIRTPALAFPDKHPTPEGHRRIAEDLYGFITKNKVAACSGVL